MGTIVLVVVVLGVGIFIGKQLKDAKPVQPRKSANKTHKKRPKAKK